MIIRKSTSLTIDLRLRPPSLRPDRALSTRPPQWTRSNAAPAPTSRTPSDSR